MVKNWFMVGLAVMCLFAAGFEFIHGRGLLGIVYVAYGVANVALAMV